MRATRKLTVAPLVLHKKSRKSLSFKPSNQTEEKNKMILNFENRVLYLSRQHLQRMISLLCRYKRLGLTLAISFG